MLRRKRPLDEQLDDQAAHADFAALPDRDRGLVRALAASVVRRRSARCAICSVTFDRGLPADAPRLETALLLGATQILWLEVPDHAAVDLAVRLVQADRRAARYAGLANAVLRRITREGAQYLSGLDTTALDTPDWLLARWAKSYGDETARAIAAANGREPALDFTVKSDPAHWASVLGGRVLPTGPVRAIVHGPWRDCRALGTAPGGAGRRRRAAGEIARRRLRPDRRRSLRRARRQDCATRRRRRPRGGDDRAAGRLDRLSRSRSPVAAAE